MSVSLKLYALRRKIKANGEVPIYLRFTEGQKYRYLSTGISVEPKFWNATMCQVRKSHPRHARLNQELEDFVEKQKAKIRSIDEGSQTLYTVSEKLREKQFENFFSYADSFAKGLGKDGNFYESRQMLVLLQHLESFFRTKSIQFRDFNLKKIEAFRTYLSETKENGPNTINKKLKRLRRIFKNARRAGVTTRDPFVDYESLPSVRPDKYRLTVSQLQTISALDLKEGSPIWHTRNTFLFSYYNAGIRFGDLCQLRWKNLVDGYLVYRMSKTSKTKKIILTKPVIEILAYYRKEGRNPDDYIFPILTNKPMNEFELKRQISSKNVISNKYLKRIAQLAGIDGNVTFHVARHSFADFARKSEISVYDISKAMDHSEIKITEQYMAPFDDLNLDKTMERLFGKA